MKHTAACTEAQEAFKVQLDQFKQKYPYYCTYCNGYGSDGEYDSSTGYNYFDECPYCNGAYDTVPTCSLCGQIIIEVPRSYDINGHMYTSVELIRQCTCPEEGGLPSEPECFCWDVGMRW